MDPTAQETISRHLLTYQKFVETTTFHPKILKCLFVNAYNHFYSGKILAEKGLITQSYNCLRMGLESEWLGLILMKDTELGIVWILGSGDKSDLKRLKDLEKPHQIRKILGDAPRITVQDRDEIYKALSDKSHTKISSITRLFIPPEGPLPLMDVRCIPMGGMQGEETISRILRGLLTVLTFALAEIEDNLGQRLLEEEWEWKRSDLIQISEGALGDEGGPFEPHISSWGHPEADPIRTAIMLRMIFYREI
ncbi:hypothetical protein [Methanoculleus bourgensis]|jgi:hypothetical protein|uniref:Uncharacterized protein n=1 Tax=Methanoculleus bourgensis TaxID=83986 RepID=A0A0X3BPI4_9EURY|nr:hypothetical protein [Methanoculleus bourgensis]CVK33957.1 protein of unknown function [Methanoculleus bourgensis]